MARLLSFMEGVTRRNVNNDRYRNTFCAYFFSFALPHPHKQTCKNGGNNLLWLFFSSYYVNKNWISWLMRHFANFQISIIFFINIKEKQTKVNWKKMMMLLYAKGFLQWWNYMSIKEKGLLVFKKDQLLKWSDRVSLVVLSSRTIWYLAAFLFVMF